MIMTITAVTAIILIGQCCVIEADLEVYVVIQT